MHIDCTNLGNLIIWSQHGQQPIQEWYQHDTVVESWMLMVLTVLDDDYPLVYTLTAGPSNGEKFVTFICSCIPFIFPGDTILGDNCSFHQRGWGSETAQGIISALGADYKLLPIYCPKFSPAEKVFSFLKTLLRASFSAKDSLLISIITILNKITTPMMLGWYCSCGWLQ